jgi:hypothetical protein
VAVADVLKLASDFKSFVGITGGSAEDIYARDWELLGTGSAASAAQIAKMIGKKTVDSEIKMLEKIIPGIQGLDPQLAGGLQNRADRKLKPWIKGAEIIEWALAIITMEELLFGPGGSPVKGNKFDDAKYADAQARQRAQSALPDSAKWEGAAADAYAAHIRTMVARIDAGSGAGPDSLLTADALMKTLVDREAQINKDYRRHITEVKDGLGIAIFVAIATNRWWPKASIPFQIIVSTTALLAVNGMLTAMACQSRDLTAAGARPVIAAYRDMLSKIATELEGLGADVPPAVKDALPSAARGFSDVLHSGAVSGVGSGVTAGTSASAGRAGGSSGERALATDGADAGDTGARYGGDDLYDGPAEPIEPVDAPQAPQTPAAPVIPMPTLAQLSGQAAKLSAQGSQHMNRVNQTMGQVQQIVSMAQQGQAAPAPAEAVALAGDVEGAEAAPDDEAAERAPLGSDGAAVASEPATETDPAQRVV